jgi:hypothetical protein
VNKINPLFVILSHDPAFIEAADYEGLSIIDFTFLIGLLKQDPA